MKNKQGFFKEPKDTKQSIIALAVVLFLLYAFGTMFLKTNIRDAEILRTIDVFNSFLIFGMVILMLDYYADINKKFDSFFQVIGFGNAEKVVLGLVLGLFLALIIYFSPIHPVEYPSSSPYLLYPLFLVIFSPIVEETIFRGIFVPTMVKFLGKGGGTVGRIVGVLIMNGLFAIYHYSTYSSGSGDLVTGLLGAWAYGISMSLLVYATGSIFPAISVHVIHNAFKIFGGAW